MMHYRVRVSRTPHGRWRIITPVPGHTATTYSDGTLADACDAGRRLQRHMLTRLLSRAA